MDNGQPETYCEACDKEWDPALCPDCGSSNSRFLEFEELLYPSNSNRCRECGNTWRPSTLAEEEVCPVCGTVGDHLDGYPAIPNLDNDYRLHLIMHAESYQARDERGALLTTELLAWMALRGVTSRLEILQWSAWFDAIHLVRSKIRDEQNETLRKPKGEDDEE